MTHESEACESDRCRRCPRSDLARLLAAPDLSCSALQAPVADVLGALPLLGEVAGVAAAGPVLSNVIGTHREPVHRRGPLSCPGGPISLRVHPEALGTAVVTDPGAGAPPTLRFFDTDGQAAYAAYLLHLSDRLAFEALSLIGPAGSGMHTVHDYPSDPGVPVDQIGLFDEILSDGGRTRSAALADGSRTGSARVGPDAVIATLTHAALTAMPVTTCTAAAGCLQLRHDRLDGVREHEGTLLLASGPARTRIDFGGITDCWLTRSDGGFGSTGALELYDGGGRCRFVVTVTGAVEPPVWEAWEHLIAGMAESET
ncbi:MAG: heme transporter [Gordonia sp. (in: high G+C Gram-positive bacteria)]|uniref:heme transporter n=1 Tax=Gordonia sp. (in: high G+C Gram-positive bacteria) TaxID=84139 RepID=UPI0039E5EC0F